MSDSVGSGQFRYYIFPFLTGGVTIRVEVFRGGVWCYGSDTNRNPSSRDYIWRLFISGYNDSYIDPRSLGRVVGPYLFIAIEGINPANDFSLNSTSGDTSIAGIVITNYTTRLWLASFNLSYPYRCKHWKWCDHVHWYWSDQILCCAFHLWRNNSPIGCFCWIHHLLCLRHIQKPWSWQLCVADQYQRLC